MRPSKHASELIHQLYQRGKVEDVGVSLCLSYWRPRGEGRNRTGNRQCSDRNSLICCVKNSLILLGLQALFHCSFTVRNVSAQQPKRDRQVKI